MMKNLRRKMITLCNTAVNGETTTEEFNNTLGILATIHGVEVAAEMYMDVKETYSTEDYKKISNIEWGK